MPLVVALAPYQSFNQRLWWFRFEIGVIEKRAFKLNEIQRVFIASLIWVWFWKWRQKRDKHACWAGKIVIVFDRRLPVISAISVIPWSFGQRRTVYH
jgi:hypothetical protein